jgi:DNA-binding response OmpR family regulator
MTALVVVTEDDAFATAICALACAELSVTAVHVEEAVAAARHDRPDILVVDADSVRDSQSLIGALSLLTQARVVVLAHQAWPTSRAAAEVRMAGADAVLPKPSGRASPTLAGLDRDAYRRWFMAIADRASDGAAIEATP